MSVKNCSDKQLLKQLSEVLCENMPQGKVDIKTLAKQLALSPSQLNRRVMVATGQTTSDFVLNIRIDKAKRLLAKFPDTTIFETARECGFADTSHFSHVFRRKVGQSPTQYIRCLHNPDPPKKE